MIRDCCYLTLQRCPINTTIHSVLQSSSVLWTLVYMFGSHSVSSVLACSQLKVQLGTKTLSCRQEEVLFLRQAGHFLWCLANLSLPSGTLDCHSARSKLFLFSALTVYLTQVLLQLPLSHNRPEGRAGCNGTFWRLTRLMKAGWPTGPLDFLWQSHPHATLLESWTERVLVLVTKLLQAAAQTAPEQNHQ